MKPPSDPSDVTAARDIYAEACEALRLVANDINWPLIGPIAQTAVRRVLAAQQKDDTE